VPPAVEKTLANGLRVVIAPKPGLPLISASLRVGAGASLDPAKKHGLASMTAELMTRGTKSRSATEIASQMESLGASIGASAGPDASDVSISTRSDKVSAAFAIMSDVVRNPAFAGEELKRARQETLDGLMLQLRQPSSVGSMAMTARPVRRRALWRCDDAGDAEGAEHERPAGVPPVGVEAGIFGAGDRWRHHAGGWLQAGRDGVWRLGWRHRAELLRRRPRPPRRRRPKSVVVDIPQVGQAAVLLGRVGPSRLSADYVQTAVANAVLGDGYSSRLNSEIRIKRGLSYGARSGLSARKSSGPIVASAQTRNDAVPQVIDLMISEFTPAR